LFRGQSCFTKANTKVNFLEFFQGSLLNEEFGHGWS